MTPNETNRNQGLVILLTKTQGEDKIDSAEYNPDKDKNKIQVLPEKSGEIPSAFLQQTWSWGNGKEDS